MATWVVGDIHGCYKDFMKILKDPEVKKKDTIILVGDIIDRGPASVKMLKWAMENVTPDGKYQMVIGNHEDTIISEYEDAVIRCGHLKRSIISTDVSEMWCQYDFAEYMYASGFCTIASVTPFIEWFKTLPEYKRVEVKDSEGKKRKYVIAHAWYGEDMSRDDIVWTRDIDLSSRRILQDMDYEGLKGEILIHGHTPTIAIKDCMEKPKNEVLFRKHSINIDTGCVRKSNGGVLSAIRLEDQKVIYSADPGPIT